MSRDDKWHIIVTNADGSTRAHGKFTRKWVAKLAIELVLRFRLGETLTILAPKEPQQ